MTNWENIWTFKTARFTVTYDVAPDDDLDLSWDDDGSVRDNLNRGVYVAFVARVRVTLSGREVGADYLGGCIYRNPQEFIDHRGSRGKWGSYFTDMVHEAVREARDLNRRALLQGQTIYGSFSRYRLEA